MSCGLIILSHKSVPFCFPIYFLAICLHINRSKCYRYLVANVYPRLLLLIYDCGYLWLPDLTLLEPTLLDSMESLQSCGPLTAPTGKCAYLGKQKVRCDGLTVIDKTNNSFFSVRASWFYLSFYLTREQLGLIPICSWRAAIVSRRQLNCRNVCLLHQTPARPLRNCPLNAVSYSWNQFVCPGTSITNR